MKKIYVYLLYLSLHLVLPTFGFASLYNLQSNALVTKEIVETVSPYLIPDNHRLKPILDDLFSTRVTFDRKSMEKAGFTILFEQPRSRIIVAKHPRLKDYLVKAYYDTELQLKGNKPGWLWFARRCVGARKIQDVITRHNIKNFIVPKKYIYILPPNTTPEKSSSVDPKLAILLVKDMKLVSKTKNLEAWKNKVSREMLNELYIIMTNSSGGSYRACNIPYSKYGKFAFVDTEYSYRTRVDFHPVHNNLSGKMRRYWAEITKN